MVFCISVDNAATVCMTDVTKTTAMPLENRRDFSPSISMQIWNLNWDEYLPHLFSNRGLEVQLVKTHYEEVERFALDHFEEIYLETQEKGRFLGSDSFFAKAPFYERAADFFAFQFEKKVIGVCACNVSDWSTYYLRNISLVPKFQGRGLYQSFLLLLLDILLEKRVERLEVEVAPNNFTHIHILTKLRFTISGFQLTERWGALVRFTKFLSEKHETVFLRQFSHHWAKETRSL